MLKLQDELQLNIMYLITNAYAIYGRLKWIFVQHAGKIIFAGNLRWVAFKPDNSEKRKAW